MSFKSQNAAVRFVDRHAQSAYADKAAYIEVAEPLRSLSYRELAERSDRMAALYMRQGLGREDRAAMLVLDRLEFPIIFWGSLKAGIIPVPINTLLSKDVIDAILRDARVKALFVSPELLPVVAPILSDHPGLKAVFIVGGSAEGHLDFAAELEKSPRTPAIEAEADETAFWLYSSGSTGKPKGVRHVHGSLGVTADTYGEKVLGLSPDDIVLSAAKMFFAYGLGNSMTFPLAVGATTVIFPGRPTPDTMFDVLGRFRANVFCGVPTLYAAMVAALERGAKIDVKLRRCISAGEALPSEVARKWREQTQCEILDGVGSTEMLHIFLSNRAGEVVDGTSGMAVPGYEIRLVDPEGREVGVGEIGELLVAGDSAAQDYWNQREKSRSTFEGRWTRTGDKYEKRADGRLMYCGRTDDMFKVGGIWLAPFEVEQALVSHPYVFEAAVVAARDEEGLEKPKAFVVLKPGAPRENLAETLKAHVQAQIGKWKYPRWVEIVDDLPKTATGKIQRFKLRD